MLKIDVGTMGFSAAMASLAVALVLAAYGGAWQSLRRWGIFSLSCAAYSIGLMAILFRGPLPPMVAIYGGNLLVMIAAWAFHAGICVLFHRRPPLWLYAVLTVIYLVGEYYYLFVEDDMNARITVVSAVRIPVFAHALLVVHLGCKNRVSWGGMLLEAVAAVWTALLAVRIFSILAVSGPVHDFVSLSGFQAVYLAAAGLGNVLIAVGLMRLDAEKLEKGLALRTADLAETNAALRAEIDIRRQAEARLQATERQLRSVLNAAPVPMVVSRFPDGRILFVNPAAGETFNTSRTQVDGVLWAEDFYVNPQDRRDLLARLSRDGEVLAVELQMRRLPDRPFWMLASLVRLTYDSEDAILACFIDISAQKELEEALRLAGVRSESALVAERASVREQSNFLAMVSHEFRMPLAIIQAASQLLAIYTPRGDEAQDELAKIGRAVRRLSDMINIFLADNRLNSNLLTPELGHVDLSSAMAEVCEEKRGDVQGRVEVRLGGDASVVAVADPALLRIAFSNLIENALKFSPPGSRVDVTVARDGDVARIDVADRGPGIAEADRPRVFEKFFRSERTNKVSGAGLGLYIVKRIIDLHGGRVGVDSVAGEGSTFFIRLPVAGPGNAAAAGDEGADCLQPISS